MIGNKMVIEYNLEKEDVMMELLYEASGSAEMKKRLKKEKLRMLILSVVFGLIMVYENSLVYGLIFFFSGLLWFFISPLIQRRRDVKEYGRHIDETYKDILNTPLRIQFEETSLLLTARKESRVAYSEIEGITEINAGFMIAVKDGGKLFLPKNKISAYDVLVTRLKSIAGSLGLKYQVDTAWK